MPAERDRERPIPPRWSRELAREHEPVAGAEHVIAVRATRSTVPRTSVAKSSASSVPSTMPPAPAMKIDTRRHDPERGAAAEEEDHLGAGRDERERDRGDRAPAARFGEPAAEDDADEPGNDGSHRRKQRDAGVREVVDVIRYWLMNCDDGALNTLVSNATMPSSTNRRPCRSEARRGLGRGRCRSARPSARVARGLAERRATIGASRMVARAEREREAASARRPRSASGSVTTANEKPNPPASPSIEAAYARAPSGASSTAASAATVEVVPTNAALQHCAAVNDDEFGAKADERAHDRRADDADRGSIAAGRAGRRSRWRRARTARRAG